LVSHDKVQSYTHPKIQSKVKGTGDMFAALLVSHLLHGKNLNSAVLTASSEVCDVLTEAEHFGLEEIGSLRALK
jgi:pyridoxine kinase